MMFFCFRISKYSYDFSNFIFSTLSSLERCVSGYNSLAKDKAAGADNTEPAIRCTGKI